MSPPHTSPLHHLPEEPLATIRPSASWRALDLRDLWEYRELLYFLTWRDLKVRYKQTLLGIVWVVLQPLMMTLIFTVFLGLLVRVPSDGVPYPLFVYAGLLPWTFFSSAVTSGGSSLVSNAHLVTKVYFPRLVVPMSSVAGRVVDFAIAFVIIIGLMAYYRTAPTWGILMLPPLVVLGTLLALGCAMLFSALNVKYRDIGILLPVVIQLWMYASPVLYPSRLVFERLGRWGWLYSLNPVVGILDGFRASLFGGRFNPFGLGVSVVVTLALLVYSAFAFRRVEQSFADVI
jgi:lipopolysaccharide transport system permease protein